MAGEGNANEKLYALTIAAPWAWAIMAGHKAVENRTWRTFHRGRLVIHAARSAAADEEAQAEFARLGIMAPNDFTGWRGCVLGTVQLTDCVDFQLLREQQLLGPLCPFATGPVCWLLESPQPCIPFVATGQQGLWLPSSAESALLA
jgi:hypothetical protein